MSESRREESGEGFYLINGVLGALVICAGASEGDLSSRLLGGAMMTPAVIYYSAKVGEEVYEAIVKYEKIKRARNIMHIRDCRRDS